MLYKSVDNNLMILKNREYIFCSFDVIEFVISVLCVCSSGNRSKSTVIAKQPSKSFDAKMRISGDPSISRLSAIRETREVVKRKMVMDMNMKNQIRKSIRIIIVWKFMEGS